MVSVVPRLAGGQVSKIVDDAEGHRADSVPDLGADQGVFGADQLLKCGKPVLFIERVDVDGEQSRFQLGRGLEFRLGEHFRLARIGARQDAAKGDGVAQKVDPQARLPAYRPGNLDRAVVNLELGDAVDFVTAIEVVGDKIVAEEPDRLETPEDEDKGLPPKPRAPPEWDPSNAASAVASALNRSEE